jgi:hypothetical protein
MTIKAIRWLRVNLILVLVKSKTAGSVTVTKSVTTLIAEMVMPLTWMARKEMHL